MFKKLSRDICLIKYRIFPLSAFDKKVDKDYFYYPPVYSFYWIQTKEDTKKNIVKESCKLVSKLEIDTLVFLGEFNKSWISKFTASRTDNKRLLKALDYFKTAKIGTKFNGAVVVNKKHFAKFLKHFFVLTGCDSGFSDFNFIDVNEDFIFHLHYSGELKVLCLNEKANTNFLSSITDTNFIDAHFNYVCDKIGLI